MEVKRQVIEHNKQELSISRQCELIGLARSSLYYEPAIESPENLRLMGLIDRRYMQVPFYGSRRMTDWLNEQGEGVNRKRIQRLMQLMGLEAIYLVAVMDWYSRYVLSWRMSNSMDSSFCVDALEEALRKYGKPEIFNSDQGAQFTCREFTGHLEEAKIQISMDGRGRALDNVFVERLWRSLKYEDIYIWNYETVPEMQTGVQRYFKFYNYERPHQSLEKRTPFIVYEKGRLT